MTEEGGWLLGEDLSEGWFEEEGGFLTLR